MEILIMKAIELIRWAMQLTDGLTARLVADLRSAPMTPATPGAKGGDGNHSVWTLGQLVPYLRLNGVKPPEYEMPF